VETELIIAGISSLIAATVGLAWYYSKKRTDALHGISSTLGMSFSKLSDNKLLASLSKYHLFSRGHSKRIKNVILGSKDGVELKIFDYRYRTGGGKNSHTRRQTVLLIKSAQMRLPYIYLRPANIFHKIGKIFGYQDVNWDLYPEFSKHYLVQAEDEGSCRAAISKELIAFFENHKGFCMETGGEVFLFYKSAKNIPPNDILGFLENGSHVFRQFSRGLKRPS